MAHPKFVGTLRVGVMSVSNLTNALLFYEAVIYCVVSVLYSVSKYPFWGDLWSSKKIDLTPLYLLSVLSVSAKVALLLQHVFHLGVYPPFGALTSNYYIWQNKYRSCLSTGYLSRGGGFHRRLSLSHQLHKYLI